MALVHYCWNQLISLLAASAESLGKNFCALGHLSLLGGSYCPPAETEQFTQCPLRFCCLFSLEPFPTLPGLDECSRLPAARPRSWLPCDLLPRTHGLVMQIPQLLFSLQFVSLLSGWFAAPMYFYLCVLFFLAQIPREPCSELLPLARSTGKPGWLLQLTCCLPQIRHFKLKLVLAFKVYSNPFNS